MPEKYQIKDVNICTFSFDKEGSIKPNLNEYPYIRTCLIDTEKNIAIDINHEVEYDYLQTQSRLYFINGASEKIKENKRAAIFSYYVVSVDPEVEKKAKDIVKKIEKGVKFPDGNDVLSNEDYLIRVGIEEEEAERKKRNPEKPKTLFKRKK